MTRIHCYEILVVRRFRLHVVPWDIEVSTVSFAVRHLWFAFLMSLYVCRFMPSDHVVRHLSYFSYWLVAYAGMTGFVWLGLKQLRQRPRAYYLARIGTVYRPLQYLNHWILPYPLGYQNSLRIWGLHFFTIALLPLPYLADRLMMWRKAPTEVIADVGVITVLVVAVAIAWYLAVTHWRERQEEQTE